MEQPSREEIARWNRWFAVVLNSLAWTLAEKSDRTAAEGEEMLHAAHASALHWSRVGNELNKVRADMLLGYIYALQRDGCMAMRFARRGYEYKTSHESADWELALAHAILAHAACTAGDMSLYAKHHAQAKILGEAISDARDKDVFRRVFDQLEIP